MVKTAVYLLC